MKKNHNFVFAFAFIVLSIVTYFAGLYQGLTHEEPATSATYTAACDVVEVDSTSQWITLVDWNGEAWCIRDEGYEVGELVIVTFDDVGTNSIYDDVIVNVRRANLVPIANME